MKITMTAIIERQRARLYTKSKKMQNVVIYKKPDTFQKARQFPLRFYIDKKEDTLRYGIFDENFKLGIYTKSMTLRKKRDNLRYVYI